MAKKWCWNACSLFRCVVFLFGRMVRVVAVEAGMARSILVVVSSFSSSSSNSISSSDHPEDEDKDDDGEDPTETVLLAMYGR